MHLPGTVICDNFLIRPWCPDTILTCRIQIPVLPSKVFLFVILCRNSLDTVSQLKFHCWVTSVPGTFCLKHWKSSSQIMSIEQQYRANDAAHLLDSSLSDTELWLAVVGRSWLRKDAWFDHQRRGCYRADIAETRIPFWDKAEIEEVGKDHQTGTMEEIFSVWYRGQFQLGTRVIKWQEETRYAKILVALSQPYDYGPDIFFRLLMCFFFYTNGSGAVVDWTN